MSRIFHTRILHQENERGQMLGHALVFLSVILLSLFLFAAVSMAFGKTVTTHRTDANKRAALSFISATIRANDVEDSLGSGVGPEGNALVLSENIDGQVFETRVYLYAGNLVEEYTKAGIAYTPEDASTIVATSTFSFSIYGDLLTITTDQGSADIAFRSSQTDNLEDNTTSSTIDTQEGVL